jgi:23S rRNA (cytosine1962-C5)-methyltransferase
VIEAGSYSLLDCGDGRRLEAFGPLGVDRPAPDANQPRRDPGQWSGAVTYRAGRGWAAADGGPAPSADVSIQLAGVRLIAKLAPGGQVGIFPEHATNASWLRTAIDQRMPAGARARLGAGAPVAPGSVGGPEILNLFAYTGLLTLVAADAGARVAHVDASRPGVQWARRNAAASGLEDRPVRWLTDDALAFVRRERRRGRRYAGLILDPPSYGHGGEHGHTGAFRFDDDIAELLAACREISEPDAFWLLSTHTPGWDGRRLASALRAVLGPMAASVEGGPLDIDAASGARLHLGAAARFDPVASQPR